MFIKNIKLKDGKIEYTFDFIEYEKSIKFNSSEEADKVLSIMI